MTVSSSALKQSTYQAAREGAMFFEAQDANYLRISGETRLDFLQRQSTNDLNLLAGDRAVTTVLTSPVARILDVLRLVVDGDAYGAITLPGRGLATAQYLQSRIFFMDRVEVADVSAQFAQFSLDGPQAFGLLRKVGGDELPEADRVVVAEIGGAEEVRVIGTDGFAGRGYQLLVAAAQSDGVAEALLAAGAARLEPEMYDLVRVEAGRPGRLELSEAYTPLEAGLSSAISESKGCYTGQEIIARQITYDKVTRLLVGIRAAGRLTVGSKVTAGDRSVGEVTSVASSPQFGEIGLAVVKRPHNEVGTVVMVGVGGEGVRGEVASLPFGQSDGIS